jgi:hypothetical protein
MKSYVIPILKGIVTGILEAKANSGSKPFIIKCSKCECSRELEDFFYKSSGDIKVENPDENSIYAGENIISIKCNNCGNEISSSDF